MDESLITPDSEPQNLILDANSIIHLKETRAWTNFISIVGFVFIGLMLIAGLAGGAALTRINPAAGEIGSGMLLVIILIMVAIYFFPIYFLFNFSRYAKIAIQKQDQSAFVECMRYLKLHYRYMGILMIIVCGIYVLAIIFGLMAGSMVNMFNT